MSPKINPGLKKGLKYGFRYLFFLAVGIVIFWLIYKDLDFNKFWSILGELEYGWIILSVLLGLLSHLIRAWRWNMLIRPLVGYRVRLYNTFLSVLILYFFNLLIPRAGELARCSVLSRYEKIPVTKLFGTVIIERIADFVFMIFLVIVVFSINITRLKDFLLAHPEINENFIQIMSLTNIILAAAVILLLVAFFFLLRPVGRNWIGERLKNIRNNFKDGIRSVTRLENTWLFAISTVAIFAMYLMMLYVVFLSFEPTRHLTIWAGTFTFLMSGLAMLAPIQGGIGPWHFMVFETLVLYGIDKTDGKIFALIAHTSTNLVYLVVGLAAFLIIPLVNRKKRGS